MASDNKKEIQRYINNFTSFEEKLNGDRELFAHELRKKALAELNNVEFPTLKDEEWKYTSIGPILKHEFVPAGKISLPASVKEYVEKNLFCGFNCHRLVFVNGLFSEELSDIKELPKGAVVKSLRKAVKENSELVKKEFPRPLFGG